MSEILEKLTINQTIIFMILNFLVLAIILRLILFKPLSKAIKERQERIEKGLKLTSEMEEKMKEFEEMKRKSKALLEKKTKELLIQAQNEGKKTKEEILKEAKEQKKKILEDAKKQIEKEKENLRAEMDKKVKEEVKKALINLWETEKEIKDQKFTSKAIKDL